MDFAEERLVSRYNSDLAKGLGNTLNRTLSMAASYRNGIVTRTAHDDPAVKQIEDAAGAAVDVFTSWIGEFQIHLALETIWGFASRCDKLIEVTAPFKLAKDPTQADRLDAVLYTLAESLRILAILAAPVLPRASAAMLNQLNVAGPPLLAKAKWGGLGEKHQLGKPSPVFPRIETVEKA
jgi:methionyl-tRNA synthetase